MLLWLSARLAAVAPNRLRAWELPCAKGAALKSKKKKKKVNYDTLAGLGLPIAAQENKESSLCRSVSAAPGRT